MKMKSEQLTATAEAQERLDEILKFLADRRANSPTATGLSVYSPRPTDIVVTTFPKAGTTFGQQLLYQTVVATGGAPSGDEDGTCFDDIGEVVPWIDYIPEMTFRYLEPSPRLYKTHASTPFFNVDKQKHFIIIRNPLTFAKSWLNFTFENYPVDLLLGCGLETKQAWYDRTIEGSILGLGDKHDIRDCGGFGSGEVEGSQGSKLGPWCLHTKAWVEYLDHPNVLVMFYEDMVKKTADAVKIVEKFINNPIALTEDKFKQVVQRCGKRHMAECRQFEATIDSKLFGSLNIGARRVRAEGSDEFKQCVVKEEYKTSLNEQIQVAFGAQDYESFRGSVRDRQRSLGLDSLV